MGVITLKVANIQEGNKAYLKTAMRKLIYLFTKILGRDEGGSLLEMFKTRSVCHSLFEYMFRDYRKHRKH